MSVKISKKKQITKIEEIEPLDDPIEEIEEEDEIIEKPKPRPPLIKTAPIKPPAPPVIQQKYRFL